MCNDNIKIIVADLLKNESSQHVEKEYLSPVDEFITQGDFSETSVKAQLHLLSEYEYQRNRTKLARSIGINVLALDAIQKNKNLSEDKYLQGKAIGFEEPEPWDDPVDGEDMLSSIEDQIRRFIIMPEHSYTAVSLWCTLTYLIDTAAVMPMLCFNSPTRECGKTRGLEIVNRLARRPTMASSISPGAMYRFIEKEHPTLILDEADSVFKMNDELRTLFNASYSRSTAWVLRCVGDNSEPRRFNTWAPKAIGLIGVLPDTLDSRSIVVPMRRKLPEEKIETLRADQDQGFRDLKRMLIRWTTDHKDEIARHDPQIPIGLSDRQADCWRELIRIADVAGGMWPKKVRNAALSVVSSTTEYLDHKIALLSDIRSILASFPGKNRWTAADLVSQLIQDESKPWIEWNRGQPLTAATLARLLKPFGIKTTDAKVAGKTLKCYKVADFEGVFTRYLNNPPQPATALNNSMVNSDLKSSPKVAENNRFRNRNFFATGVSLNGINKKHVGCGVFLKPVEYREAQNDYVTEIN